MVAVSIPVTQVRDALKLVTANDLSPSRVLVHGIQRAAYSLGDSYLTAEW